MEEPGSIAVHEKKTGVLVDYKFKISQQYICNCQNVNANLGSNYKILEFRGPEAIVLYETLNRLHVGVPQL